jgi:ferredoxin
VKVKVDGNLCAGASECEATCPQVFQIVDDVSRVHVGTVPAEAGATWCQAVENCLMGAVSIIEEKRTAPRP